MELFLSKFKSEKCFFNCSDPRCQKFHSMYDYRRPDLTYSSILCPDAIKNGLCTHANCLYCSNYTEYLYHINNYKERKCIAVKIGAECKLQEICPFAHKDGEKEEYLNKLKNKDKLEPNEKIRIDEVEKIDQKKDSEKKGDIEKTEDFEEEKKNAKEGKEFKIEDAKAQEFVPSELVQSANGELRVKYFYSKEVNMFEDRYNEFKECRGRNFDISYACNLISTYVSAYLNTDGGKVFYGISDSGIVSGVKLIRRSRDLFTQSFDNLLNKFRPPVGPELYTVSFVPVYMNEFNTINDLYIIEIVVKKGDSKKIYYTHKEEAFIKRDSSVSQLKGPSLVEFSKGRE